MITAGFDTFPSLRRVAIHATETDLRSDVTPKAAQMLTMAASLTVLEMGYTRITVLFAVEHDSTHSLPAEQPAALTSSCTGGSTSRNCRTDEDEDCTRDDASRMDRVGISSRGVGCATTVRLGVYAVALALLALAVRDVVATIILVEPPAAVKVFSIEFKVLDEPLAVSLAVPAALPLPLDTTTVLDSVTLAVDASKLRVVDALARALAG